MTGEPGSISGEASGFEPVPEPVLRGGVAPADTHERMLRFNPRLLGLVSPGMRLLRGLGGRVLPCGCLVGVYETYGGETVASIDARGIGCRRSDHRLHEPMVLPASEAPSEPDPRERM